MKSIPDNFVNYKSTVIMDKNNVLKMFLHLHNTRAGVYGKINVLAGQLKFFGFVDRKAEVEREIIINRGEAAISPPEYWHKVELMTDYTQFRVDFYAEKDSEIVMKNSSERN